MNPEGQEVQSEFVVESQDYDFIDEEISRLATEFTEKAPLDSTVKNALSKKKKISSDELEDISFEVQQQTENFKKMIEFASKSI